MPTWSLEVDRELVTLDIHFADLPTAQLNEGGLGLPIRSDQSSSGTIPTTALQVGCAQGCTVKGADQLGQGLIK
ncbi:hypothetical protein OMW55_12500 [Sphingomonas sp. BN140010]|uniref:Uncharacterized protein n=1 Tax=Sphingomonas arvum TaxID=2992113 RepID=A0ABT3JHT2_9SPHN|nr:hypothetical protein [Sphingomonas sp. BN140010]MCW3798627.1 hypothetical protein [Sphingomonas sp. BN140010]